MAMAQHFLLSSKAKTLTLAHVFRMTDAEAEGMFKQIRWRSRDGAMGNAPQVLPGCERFAIWGSGGGITEFAP